MSADGKDQHRLTKERGDTSKLSAAFFQDQPAWSPDASLIAFSSNRTGRFQIYVMRPDGSGTRRAHGGAG